MSRKPLMSNGAKLVIIVLSFFLALTFVRAISLDADSQQVIFAGREPVTFPLSVTNSGSRDLSLSFVADGPFSISLPPASDLVLSSHDSRTFVLKLSPSPLLRVGDAYKGQIRVLSSEGEVSLPLSVRVVNPRLFSSSSITGLFSFASVDSFSSVSLVDAALAGCVVILGIALIARVKNRVIGG